jgi:hypothetical protein
MLWGALKMIGHSLRNSSSSFAIFRRDPPRLVLCEQLSRRIDLVLSRNRNSRAFEHTAKLKRKIKSVAAHRYPIDVMMLTRQETFFAYVRECYWHLAEAYQTGRKVFKGSPLHPRLARPSKHN